MFDMPLKILALYGSFKTECAFLLRKEGLNQQSYRENQPQKYILRWKRAERN